MVIGGGIGRDCSYLRNETDIAKVHVVEVSHHNYDVLRKAFDEGSPIDKERRSGLRPDQEFIVHNENIGDPAVLWSEPGIDVAFWMFAGILELSPGEKRRSIENLYSMIKPGGSLVIDLPIGPATSSVPMVQTRDTLVIGSNPHAEAVLRLHPFLPNREVDVAQIISIVERTKRFHLNETHEYLTDSVPPQPRKFLVFQRKQ